MCFIRNAKLIHSCKGYSRTGFIIIVYKCIMFSNHCVKIRTIQSVYGIGKSKCVLLPHISYFVCRVPFGFMSSVVTLGIGIYMCTQIKHEPILSVIMCSNAIFNHFDIL